MGKASGAVTVAASKASNKLIFMMSAIGYIDIMSAWPTSPLSRLSSPSPAPASVGRAAERLSRTQPSISARLLALEGAWGTKLFRRHARGMALTPKGARLLPLAEAALEGLGALDRAAGVPVSGHDELRIGAGDALGREVVPGAIARLLRARPTLSIRVLEGPAPRLLEALRTGEIDLALAVGASGATWPACRSSRSCRVRSSSSCPPENPPAAR